jgi:hypothetical protein
MNEGAGMICRSNVSTSGSQERYNICLCTDPRPYGEQYPVSLRHISAQLRARDFKGDQNESALMRNLVRS